MNGIILLVGTYDLGRQPFGLASAAAWLTSAGLTVISKDLSRDKLADEDIRRAELIAFYLPMHTATRLALPVVEHVRRLNPKAALAAYGLYAPLSAALLREHGVAHVLGPEAEADLVNVALGVQTVPAAAQLPRLAFLVPDRTGLPSLGRYATLTMPDGAIRQVGATDATRGCKHRCRHCPIVPVYDGRFRVVPLHVVLADIDNQVAAGAEHVTFGDPDFFNGPTHARKLVEALHARHPSLTYDVTIKVEHLRRHRDLLPLLGATGCAFITSAVESIDDEVLTRLEKGHTRDDFFEAVQLCDAAGVPMSPTFVAFTPWTSLESYRDLLLTIDALGLVNRVAPVQWGLRLLVTYGSRLLELADIQDRLKPYDSASLTYPWEHADPRVDRLQADVMRAVGVRSSRSRDEVFDDVCALAGVMRQREASIPQRASIPFLNEPWYC